MPSSSHGLSTSIPVDGNGELARPLLWVLLLLLRLIMLLLLQLLLLWLLLLLLLHFPLATKTLFALPLVS